MTPDLTLPSGPPDAPVLHAYLLGAVEFEAALQLQRRLVYEVSGDRGHAALVLCEHPPLITVGRQGSYAHLHGDLAELRARRWRVRWVNRGGGCVLHVPGQLAVYPVFPLDRLGLGLQAYLDLLQQVLADTLADFMVRAHTLPGKPGVWANGRPVAGVGVAVRDWVSYYGAYLNVGPCLDGFRVVRCGGPDEPPMTSLERERHGRVRPAHVRERMLEHFATCFGFARTVLFSDHPGLNRKAGADAIASPA
jgi:lipoyl(octanoyl) transferase